MSSPGETDSISGYLPILDADMIKFYRYRICGRGSSIENSEWAYHMGDFNGDVSYAKEHILEVYESWAPWSEYYKLEVELDVTPPFEVLLEEMNEALERYQRAYNDIELLSEMISRAS